ncbi:MAG: hypothetical protein O2958_06160 [Gemmatimonadetes bacterium]|nr:hypothetical protein [Gemmatimonadota bacterium]
MTPEEFSAVTAACDLLLRGSGPSVEAVAIPWLHVLNEHPSNLARYEDLLLPRAPMPQYLRRAIRIGKRQLKAQWDAPMLLPEAPSGVDVVFFSHLLNVDMLDREDDFYFGDLQAALEARGLTSVMVLFNQTGVAGGDLAGRVARSLPSGRFLLPSADRLGQDLRTLRGLRPTAGVLNGVARKAPDRLLRRVAKQAAYHALDVGTLSNLSLHRRVGELVALLRPKAVVVTYEGHAWERMVFHAARQAFPEVNCVGYQHTILFPRQHSALRRLGKGFDPDIILTVGELNRARLLSRLPEVDVQVYGSHRASMTSDPPRASRPTRCLVIPDGILSECEVLFDFAIACSLALPDIEFVLRTHPVMPFSSVARARRRFQRLPSNVTLSRGGAIRDDATKCRWVLYRGSSAVVASTMGGARPIYLSLGEGELDIDPLGELREWRRVVRSPSDMARIVAEDSNAGEGQLQKEALPAVQYCASFATAPRFKSFCSTLGLS